MATPGYEPVRKLAEILYGTADLTSEQWAKGGDAVWRATLPPIGQTALGMFLASRTLMLNQSGLPPAEEKLAEGLLDCLQHNRVTEDPPMRGIYDHFKGGVYLIVGHLTWASGNGETAVKYISMTTGREFGRLASQWCEVVQWPDGKYRSRFVYRGEDLSAPEPTFKVPTPTVSKD